MGLNVNTWQTIATFRSYNVTMHIKKVKALADSRKERRGNIEAERIKEGENYLDGKGDKADRKFCVRNIQT